MLTADRMARLIDDALHDRISRRAFTRRALALGLSLPAASAILIAAESADAATRAGTGLVDILVGFGTGNDPSQIPIQQQIANKLMARHHGLQIRFDRVLSSDIANQKLTLQIASGRPPQVIMPTGLYGINLFIDKGVWQDLGPQVRADGVKLEDLYLPAAVDAARAVAYYGPTSTHVIGLPVTVHGHFLGINNDLFKKAGVPIPTYGWGDPAWNYNKILELAQATTLDAHGHRANHGGFDPTHIVQYGFARFDPTIVARGYGARIPYNPATKKPGYDTPEFINGLRFAADMQNKYHVVPDDATAAALSGANANEDGRLMAWLSGRMAMAELCSCDLPTWGAVKSFKWSVIAIPTGPKRLFADINLDVGAIVSSRKHNGNVDGAWEVLKGYLLDPDNERRFSYSSLRGIPALKQNAHVFGDALRRDYPKLDAAIITESVSHGSDDGEAWHPAYTQIDNATGPIFDLVMHGRMTAAQAGPLMQKAAQKALDDWFAHNKLPA